MLNLCTLAGPPHLKARLLSDCACTTLMAAVCWGRIFFWLSFRTPGRAGLIAVCCDWHDWLQYAMQDCEALSLKQMLDFGRDAWKEGEKILKSARYVQREVGRAPRPAPMPSAALRGTHMHGRRPTPRSHHALRALQ